LDDYEEGTWTPGIQNSCGFSVGAVNSAIYTKIGNTVFIQTYYTLTGTGNSTAFTVSGLPFSVPSGVYCTGAADIGTGGVLGAYVRTESTNTYATFLYSGGGTTGSTSNGRQPLLANQMGAGYVIFSLVYSTS